jgi:Zn-dependent M28 family amino/carboxypeptidase
MSKLRWVVAFLLLVLVVPFQAGTAGAEASICATRANNTPRKIMDCVTLEGVREHQAALQAIADANNGNRFAGLPGHDASVEYVVDTLTAAGYSPTVQEFDYLAFTVLGASALQQTAPGTVTYVEDVDFAVIDQSDPGDVTAAVTPVGIELGLGNATTSGCEPEDFDGFPAGNIALLQRGVCTFELKAENAAAAGVAGIVIMNQGNTPDRVGIPPVTLTANNTSGIPVLGVTYDLGASLSAITGLEMRVFANTEREIKTTANVIAETAGGRANNVVMVGAHLDSVFAGPGINDNGSGSAAILEVAEQMANVTPNNKVRFAWWSAEESGLVGSDFYVASLSPEELGNLALYLNFDMVGSPNFVRFVYDGDGSTFGLEGPPGSGAIEAGFNQFYADRTLAFEATAIDFRSDYAAFFDNGVPFGGLFTGAEVPKTPEQVLIYGGTAGMPYDPCYHQACDTFANNNNSVLDLNSDSIANAVIKYSKSTETVNGVRGNGHNLASAEARQAVALAEAAAAG